MLFHLFDQIDGAVKESFLETLRKDAASHPFVRAHARWIRWRFPAGVADHGWGLFPGAG